MKKIMTKCAFCLALLLCCVAVLAACGTKNHPTPTYKALHKYIKDNGEYIKDNSVALKYENLKDSNYKKLDITVYADDDSISFWYSWLVSASLFDSSHVYILRIAFSRDQDEPVRISYSETVSGISLWVNARSTDITTLSYGFEVYDVSKDSKELSDASSEYREAVSDAKTAVRNLQSWISAIVSVLLDDESLSVQDLYNPS